MGNSFAIRLLGTLGLHALAAAIMAGWALTRGQPALAPEVIARAEGMPERLIPYLDDLHSVLVSTGSLAIALSALLACIWLWLVQADPPHDDRSARSKRPLWAGFLVGLLVVTALLYWLRVLSEPASRFMAADVGPTALGITALLALLAYWVSTGLFVPAASRPSVPLFG